MLNLVLSVVFIVECVIKLIGYGYQVYFNDPSNKFDFFVVITSIIDIVMGIIGNQVQAVNLIRVVRVLRISRLLRLIKKFEHIQYLIQTLIYSFPKLFNVLGLLFLVMFISAVLGCFLFATTISGTVLEPHYMNFKNLGLAMVTLFRCSTGEDWQSIMDDLTKDKNNKYAIWAPVFMVTYIVFIKYVMLNLFILVLIEQFSSSQEHFHYNPVEEFEINLEFFRKHWAKFTKKYNGVKMHYKDLMSFFIKLGPQLGGFKKLKSEFDKNDAAQKVFKMGLEQDEENAVYFNDVLYSCFKRVFGTDLFKKGTEGSKAALLLHI